MGKAVGSETKAGRPAAPILRLLVVDIVVLVALAVVPLAAVAVWGYARAMDDTAHARAHEGLQRTADALRAHLGLHRRAADVVARLCVSEGPERCRSPVLHGTLAAIAPAEKSFRSLGVVFADGWVLDVAPWEDGFVTEDCTPEGAIARCEARYWDAARADKGTRRAEVNPRFDTARRPWYGAAVARAREDGRWSAPFIQEADGALINRYRMTYARKIPLEGGVEVAGGVAESSLSLDELLADVKSMQPSTATITFITDDARRPMLLPPLPEFRGIEATPVGRPISPDFLPIADGALAAAAREERLAIGGEDYYFESLRFEGEPGISWTISMGIPANELLVGPRRIGLAMLALAGLALIAVAWRAARLARRFSAPLRALAAASEKLAQGETMERSASGIAEIDEVRNRFTEAGTAVRARARLEADLRHAQRVATIGTLTGGVVHDINNQLTALLGALELATREGEENPDLALARDAATACAELTRGLLAFSRGGTAIARKPIDLVELVRKTAQLLGGTLKKSGVDLRLDVDPAPLVALGDRVLLEQVVVNLALNARDAMPGGGRLTLATTRRGGDVVLSVTDTGSGIGEDVRSKIFDAFFTTKSAGEGTGLGLSIAQGIVHAHGGRIEIDSTPGRGSTFAIVLAAAPRPPAASSAETTR